VHLKCEFWRKERDVAVRKMAHQKKLDTKGKPAMLAKVMSKRSNVVD
jgi:hypothetical protein